MRAALGKYGIDKYFINLVSIGKYNLIYQISKQLLFLYKNTKKISRAISYPITYLNTKF